ncbi:MAG: 16S rRNA (adenine(1518)-N(6)/adenine(1519)-N(6))-dimethyltransferase RsmA [Patescibacteria group bacterium]|mgnify:CR=1 FL=1
MTPIEARRILRTIGLRPQQAAGQNFLLEERIAESMVDAAGIKDGQPVLEIGPGLGILTRALLHHGAKVIAVELDTRLYAYMKQAFKGQTRLRLINNDIFKVNLSELFKEGEYALVANLPYSATSLVFRNFLTLSPRPSSMTVMIQRDVAKRITARPGAMSLLALTVQHYCRPTCLFDVPPSSFFPAPKVTSSVVHGHDLRPVNPDFDRALFRLMRAGFSSRRKQLHNTIAATRRLESEVVIQHLASIGLPATVRPQELSLENWLSMAKKFS